MSLRIYGATSGYVDLDAPAVAGSASVTLPGSGTLALYSQLKVLQVVRATDTTQRSTTSTSYTDVTGVSITITPRAATSNIILIATGAVHGLWTTGNGDNYVSLQIADSSNNAISGAEETFFGVGRLGADAGNSSAFDGFCLIGYASLASTSAVTYKLRFKTVANTTAYINTAGTRSATQFIAMEIAA